MALDRGAHLLKLHGEVFTHEEVFVWQQLWVDAKLAPVREREDDVRDEVALVEVLHRRQLT